MTIALPKQLEQKIQRAARATGVTPPDVVNRALDVFLAAQEAVAGRVLHKELHDWQELGFEAWRGIDE